MRQPDRRSFLASCLALVGALSGCRSALSRTRYARLALDDPHPDDYQPVLDALIRTILPFDHPRFPRVTVEAVRARLLALFPLEEDRKYLAFQNGLMIFGELDLFPLLQAPLVSEERRLAGTSDGALATKARQDELLYAEFLRTSLPAGARPFTTLDASQRARYLRLWSRSGFDGKRLFYSASKTLAMVTAYSLGEFWSAIGYAGPLLTKRP